MTPVKADIDCGNVDTGLKLCSSKWKAFVLDKQEQTATVLNRPITNIKTPFAPRETDICQDAGGFYFSVKAFPIKSNNTFSLTGCYTHTYTQTHTQAFPSR